MLLKAGIVGVVQVLRMEDQQWHHTTTTATEQWRDSNPFQHILRCRYLTNVGVALADGVLARAGRGPGVLDVGAVLRRGRSAAKDDYICCFISY